MLWITGLLGILITSPLIGNTKVDLDFMKNYLWKNRILLVFSPTQTNPHLLNQRSWNSKNRPGFDDRHLLVFEIVNNNVLLRLGESAVNHNASVLRSQFSVKKDQFRSLVIGKDGTIKYNRPIPADPCYLFGLIDSMPMRRQEIYNNSKFVGCIE